MTPDEYQAACRRTWVNSKIDAVTQRRQHAALGLASEAGELAAILIKGPHYGKHFTAADVLGELGDALWYLTMLADEYGLTLDEIMEANIAKLEARHPDGFSHDKYTGNDEGHVYRDFS